MYLDIIDAQNPKKRRLVVAEKIIYEYIPIFLALLIVLPFHEFAHAFAAVKCGDLTPKLSGRYTLNPMAHFDALGLLCFVLAHFGWAKPVPVNPDNFRHYKRGCFWVASAGVIMNYILAFVFIPLCFLSLRIPSFGYFTAVLQNALYYVVALSLSFFVFNLIPVYPLDGFHLYATLSKKRGGLYNFLRYKGIYVLYALMLLGVISDYTGIWQLDILGIAMNFLVTYLGWPLWQFWTWIWGLFV